MRVALIGPVPPSRGGSSAGGVATHLAHLADGLSSASGIDAALLGTNTRAAAAPRGPSGWLRRARCAGGLRRLVGYALVVRQQRGVASRQEVLAQLLAYRAFLEHVRPDVIHVQHPLERMSYLRTLRRLEPRGSLGRTPIVVTAHSFFGEHPDQLIRGVMAPNLAAADRVIAVSPHIGDQAIELGVPPERIRVIRSGVDTERFAPGDRAVARQQLQLDADAPLVLFVGNLEPRKQLHVLLRAMSWVVEVTPAAQLAILGTGLVRDELERLRRDLALELSVRLVGSVDDDALLRWYHAADVFTLPSSSEAQGIVALEAMACGVPVVASAVGGLLGTIDDGKNGYLVPSGDAVALANRLRDLFGNPSKRMELGAAARAKVERDFSWRRAVEATVEVYREAVACRAA